jgi:hypothetical protein
MHTSISVNVYNKITYNIINIMFDNLLFSVIINKKKIS